MYEELVSNLRAWGKSDISNWRICNEAADAIENLSDGYNRLSKHMDDLATLLPQMSLPQPPEEE